MNEAMPLHQAVVEAVTHNEAAQLVLQAVTEARNIDHLKINLLGEEMFYLTQKNKPPERTEEQNLHKALSYQYLVKHFLPLYRTFGRDIVSVILQKYCALGMFYYNLIHH